MDFINVGYNNMIAAERIIALVTPESAPAKRLIQDAKDTGRAVDCTSGKKTKSVIITDSDHVVLSALTTEQLAERLAGGFTEEEYD